LTKTNYPELETLYAKYKDQGLVILGMPCNSFKQEKESNEEILAFARDEKHTTFPVFAKLKCEEGDETHPLYKYLRSTLNTEVKWNFSKFLVNKHGVPIKLFEPKQSPLSFESEIVALLNQ
jgi:glutathione peroxidase